MPMQQPQSAPELFPLPPAGAAVTPLLAQYLRLKQEYAEYLLFFRLGDFYELFFDDAVRAAGILHIALTKRGQHQGQDVPMCGVPWHQAENYLAKLLQAGLRVALAEQVETPIGKNKLMERRVTRLLTPGTVLEDNLLVARRHNFITALAPGPGSDYCLAAIDMSCGEFLLENAPIAALPGVLARLDPAEILLPETMAADAMWRDALGPYAARLRPQSASRFATDAAKSRLQAVYAVASLDALGLTQPGLIATAGAVVQYVQLTQQQNALALQYPQLRQDGDYLHLDAATARNLELRQSQRGTAQGSILFAIDRTITAPGGRLLDQWLSQPLCRIEPIRARQAAVGECLRDARRPAWRQKLRAVPDLARAANRLLYNRGGPRDLMALRDGLAVVGDLRQEFLHQPPKAALLQAIVGRLGDYEAWVARLHAALADELPHYARDGGFIRTGFDAALDYQRQLSQETLRVIAELQSRYAQQSGVANLKIKHNNLIGYFIEVPPKFADKMANPPFTHRQSLANAVRYGTPELADLEQQIAKAAQAALAMELELFATLVAELRGRQNDILQTATAMAEWDVLLALAELAAEQKYICPEITEDVALDITGGRHPVVEQALQKDGQAFIANDCHLGTEAAGRLWLLTGPNMAGKSTFLRQNAVLAILAQMGSFVPAQAARIGLCDKIFSRVGAADDLARGQSTFMVEMAETAAILHQATARSLVILDEIGRGTATADGLAIAQAVLEYLHDQLQCRGLFATHYHELTALAKNLPALRNYTAAIADSGDKIVFLHRVTPGVAAGSYGLHVAQLAGLPLWVLRRARAVMQQPAVAENPPLPMADLPSPILAKLAALDLNHLTPKQAWDLLAEWQAEQGQAIPTRHQ
jgi:DNA mismatch repair protein MutS